MIKKILNWFIDEICRTWSFLAYLLIVAMLSVLLFTFTPLSEQATVLYERPVSELTVGEVLCLGMWGYAVFRITKLAKLFV